VTEPPLISAVAFPDPDGVTWQPVMSGLSQPVDITGAGDGSGRLFVVEQAGLILILREGVVSAPEVFLDIRDRVGSQGLEQGLLGLAFHPRYRENGFFFVNYTDLGGDTVIARFQVMPGDPERADPGSELRLLNIPQPFRNHNGGAVLFGPDGYLYLGLGDGGSAGDPQGNGQSLASLLGKILRLDVDQGNPYAIPPGNPFDGANGRPEIWAYGLRNPWRMAFDRLSGDLYIGDVGQNAWEEIDFLPAGSPGGANFGWNYYEGSHAFQGLAPANLAVVAPVAEYDHGLGCSVTGGVIYRGSRLPDWQGIYLYGDYCTGNVWGLLRDVQGLWQSQLLFTNLGSISSFGQDESGEIYQIDHSGTIYTLVPR
jgi:glucose/arabinose dehydrogenase